jgi:hypothetical protein
VSCLPKVFRKIAVRGLAFRTVAVLLLGMTAASAMNAADMALPAGTFSERPSARQMFSAESLTSPHPGFPELFQTGETYHGEPLVDHQHPHNVFAELSLL